MTDRTCQRCGRVFRFPRDLRSHHARKTPCAPILEPDDLPEDLRGDPDFEKRKCRFCGRVFASYDSMRRHVRNTCKIAPNEKNGDAGMEALYEHTVLRMQQRQAERIAALEELVAKQADMMMALKEAPHGGQVNIAGDQNVTLNTQVVINTFGREKTDHLSPDLIREVLEEALRISTGPIAASAAVMKTAMLVYSDPVHPENLTCYLPNKKTNDALVHAARPDGTIGWEVRPCSLVLPPMAQKSVDTLFDNQPFEDADAFEPLMKELRDNEERYAAGGELRPVLVRNKALLTRALKTLPVIRDIGDDV